MRKAKQLQIVIFHIIILSVFLILELVLLTKLIKNVIIEMNLSNHDSSIYESSDDWDETTKTSAVSEIISEEDFTDSSNSNLISYDFSGDGVVNQDDYDAFVDIYKKEFAPLHKKYEELSDEEHEKFDYLDLDNNKKINISDGDEIRRQYE